MCFNKPLNGNPRRRHPAKQITIEDETLKNNENELEWDSWYHGDKIEHKRKNFTKNLTTNKMVVSLYKIPPEKVSWPFHYHIANEEIFYIIEGEGELRTNNKTQEDKPGDFFRFPIGKKGVHQLKNTSTGYS